MSGLSFGHMGVSKVFENCLEGLGSMSGVFEEGGLKVSGWYLWDV